MLAVLAVLSLLTNFFSLELFTYSLAGVFGLYLCLFGKDMLPLAPTVLFLYVSPSLGNNPVYNPDSVFFPERWLWLFVAIIVVFVVLFFLRLCLTVGLSRFLKERRKLLTGFLVLGAAFFLGGIGYEEYTARNLLYAFLLFGSMFALYFLVPPMVDWKKAPKDYFFWAGLFLGLVVAAELIFAYCTNGVIDAEGSIVRGNIRTGWGQHNTIGAVLAVCMPCAFYLAVKKKYGFIFSALGVLLYVAVVATNSRGSILMGGIVFLVCVVMTLVHKKNRLGNGLVFLAAALAAGVLLGIFRDDLENLFSVLLEIELDPSGRDELFKDGMEKFRLSPLFGSGFFSIGWGGWGDSAMTILPYFWHNTFVEMLAACGVVGLAAYLFHRFQTIRLFFTAPTWEKSFLAASAGVILLTSLLDCHLFNIGITFIYSALLLFAEKSEESEREAEEDFLLPLFRELRRKIARRAPSGAAGTGGTEIGAAAEEEGGCPSPDEKESE